MTKPSTTAFPCTKIFLQALHDAPLLSCSPATPFAVLLLPIFDGFCLAAKAATAAATAATTAATAATAATTATTAATATAATSLFVAASAASASAVVPLDTTSPVTPA